MKNYLILMRGGNDILSALSDTEFELQKQSWYRYINNLVMSGSLVGGIPLHPGGRVVNKQLVSDDAVLSSNGEVISGYLIIKAIDYDDAVKLVEPCPVIENNGNVEVREMVANDMAILT
jgi:hypothetical protein